MKYIILISIFIFNTFVQAESLPKLSNLDSLEWKNRVVILNEIKNQDKSLLLLKEQVAQIDDRDIIWFSIKDNLVLSNYKGDLSSEFVTKIREKFSHLQNKVILIGKDGGIKSQSDYLNLEDIFSEVDSMPMRLFEIQKR
ncbi:MAG: DUF4174 domain-containing protein [Aliarcobacter sp.]|nr:DUF4174 domain-containing protein [Aliarcobacter sp.]